MTALLHAMGAPRPHFNLSSTNKEDPSLYGPLEELLS